MDDQAQRERALQAWELVIEDDPDEAVRMALRKVLRVKRFDMESVASKLPGSVRRGARVDLEPLCQELRSHGVRCSVRRRARPEEQL